MNVSFLQELLGSVAEQGRQLLPRSLGGSGPEEDIQELAAALSGQGEASGVAIAGAVLARYRTSAPDERRAFLAFLAETMQPDGDALASAAKAYLANPDATAIEALHWGVEKPATAFFDRVVVAGGRPADQVLYVGDRLDNDIRPAQEAGMATALIRRGPWGYILDHPTVSGRMPVPRRIAGRVTRPGEEAQRGLASRNRRPGRSNERPDLLVELRTMVAVAEDRTYCPDPFEPGAVPVGAEHGERLAEVVGRAVAVVAVRGGEIGKHDAALLRAGCTKTIESAAQVIGSRGLVAGGEGGIAGEGVQPSSVVEVQPCRCNGVGIDRRSGEIDLVPTRSRRCRRDLRPRRRP